MKIDEAIITELVAIERAVLHASELIDLSPLRDRSLDYAERSAKRKELRERREKIRERINDSVLWTVYSAISRAEAEAIEWRAYARALGAPRGAQLSLDVDARADGDEALRRPGATDGEARRREAAGD